MIKYLKAIAIRPSQHPNMEICKLHTDINDLGRHLEGEDFALSSLRTGRQDSISKSVIPEPVLHTNTQYLQVSIGSTSKFEGSQSWAAPPSPS